MFLSKHRQNIASLRIGKHRIAKKSEHRQPLFLGTDKEISEKRNFFVNRPVPENFQWEIFSGQVPTESLRTQDSEKSRFG